jgi:CheY-like chemotaxis protein
MIGKRWQLKDLAPVVESSSRRYRVLVVEDEEAVAEGLRLLLEQEYHVDLASSGRRALDMLSSGAPFDAVLCDLMMPGMSGIELFDALKVTSPGTEERLVFMTGGAFTPEAEAFLDEISNARVEKPFDFASVDRLLRLVASGKSIVQARYEP